MNATTRRKVLLGIGGSGFVALAGREAVAFAAEREREKDGEDTPIEDFMREHAVLDRILLVYEEAARRIDEGIAFDPLIVTRAARLVRSYIEEHHERDEEEHVFPRTPMPELVKTLLAQHVSGRALTDAIISRENLASNLRAFVRMYRPHAARENTILFPAFRRAISASEYEDLHDKLEEEERVRYGGDLWERVLVEVSGLERAINIG